MRNDKLLVVEIFIFKDDINHHRLQRRPYLKAKHYVVVIFDLRKKQAYKWRDRRFGLQ